MRGRGTLVERKQWVMQYLFDRWPHHIDLTTSCGVDDSLTIMADFANAFLPRDVTIGVTQRAFGRVLRSLVVEGKLRRQRVSNQDARHSGQPNWCYTHHLPEETEQWLKSERGSSNVSMSTKASSVARERRGWSYRR